MLKFLGKFAKGYATVAGVATTVAGLVLSTEAAQTVVAVSDGGAQVIYGIGAILAAFGYGRKTGYAGAQAKARGE